MSETRERTLSKPESRSALNDAAKRAHPPTAHTDTFVQEHLPPKGLWPVMNTRGIKELDYPATLNAAAQLLDRSIETGFGSRPCLHTDNGVWSYQKLLEWANRLANLLVGRGLAPGERVLLRDANTPMLAACWFAVLKAGGIAVTTMPQLRAQELAAIAVKARVRYALCAREHSMELIRAQEVAPVLEKVILYDNQGEKVPPLLKHWPVDFANVATLQDDVAL